MRGEARMPLNGLDFDSWRKPARAVAWRFIKPARAAPPNPMANRPRKIAAAQRVELVAKLQFFTSSLAPCGTGF